MNIEYDTHGRLKCATITTPLFIRSLNDYRRVLGYNSVEDGVISAEQAEAWAAPDSAGKRYALLQSKRDTAYFLRLVEGTYVDAYQATRSFGWASVTLPVMDVMSLHESVEADGAFSIITANTVSLYVRGQANEILNLTQFNTSDADFIFLATLAAPNSASALNHYINAFTLDAGATEEHIRPIINLAFSLPDTTKTPVSMVTANRVPVLEIEQYPAGTDVRPMRGSELPPGLSILTMAVRNLDDIEEDFLAAPCVRHGPLYAGCRTATVMGPADELIELIELG